MTNYINTPSRIRQRSLRQAKGGIAMTKGLLLNITHHNVLPLNLNWEIIQALAHLTRAYDMFNSEVGWGVKDAE